MYTQMQKMMTNFQGYTNIMTILSFICFISFGAFTSAARNDIMSEFSTSDDFRREVGYGEEKLSTVLVTGSILCDACVDQNSLLQSYPISGASVAVSCDTSRKTSESDWVKGTTDEYGDFLIDLPSHLHAIPNMEKKCLVNILELPKDSPCHRALKGEHRGIKFLSMDNGFRTYTAHDIHLTTKYSQPCIKKQATV
uniref:uncharacterized protein LOC122581138 n=1 Tax=Erigeron canadensis TaxID=72917 RepID=UPI001CB96CC5|nr:uncharacterized protein LOC122581138 [Erigeron canadensis]